jgi:hypothetical protein
MSKLEETSRKKLSRQTKDSLYWLKWRVTFMWRDPDYLKAWDKIKKIRQKAGYSIEFVDLWLDNNYRNTKEFAKECKITENFDYMGMFINPQKSFDQMITGNNSVKLSLKAYLIGVFLNKSVIINPSKAKYDQNVLLLKIDFSKINQITNTIKIINEKIMIEYQCYLIENKRDSFNKTDFDKILQVGTLKRDNPLITWPEIAREVFKNDSDPDSASIKAFQHDQRYKALINGGWRRLLFP